MLPTLVFLGCVGGSDSKESACNSGDLDSVPGLGRHPGEGNSYPLQYSCLENSTDRGAWRATVHGVTESDTTERLSLFTNMGFWVFQGLSCLSGSSHLSLPGHSGSSPRLVQIRSSHFHQDWKGCTGDHPVFRDIFHKIPSGKQQPPVTTAGFIARGAWRVQHISHRRRMCLPPGEILRTEGPESPWSLKSPNSANDGANERVGEAGRSSGEGKITDFYLFHRHL